MYKKIRNLLVVIGMLLFFSGAAHAFSKEDIQFWAGEGENEVGFIINFNDGSETSSVAWGYRYDGDIGSYSMEYVDFMDRVTLAVIDADDLLSGEYHTYSSPLWYGFKYGDHDQSEDPFDPSTTHYWLYYATSASEIDGNEEWTILPQSPTNDIQWVEWEWLAYSDPITISPNIPTAAAGNNTVPPVPEPGTFVLLGLGLIGTGIIARRKKLSQQQRY